MRVLSVSQINFFIKSLIEGDGRMRDIYARGEISNFTDHYRSGHLYFSLKDEKSVLEHHREKPQGRSQPCGRDAIHLWL